MSMTHSTIAQIFTNRLALEEFHDAENSVERGRCAEMEAWSLTRLVMRLVTWGRAPAVPDTQVELQAAVKRLSELSPHLLIDVGIDPATGELVEDGVSLVAPRPIRHVEPAQDVVAPVPVVEVRRPARLRLQIRVLPVGETAPVAAG